MTATPTPRPHYTIHPINPTIDYPTLTTISLSAFTSNPLHYLTFRSPLVPFSEISAYHRATRIEIADEGNSVRTFKVIENEDGEGEGNGEGKVVAFASWVFDSSWPEGRVKEVTRPEGMDMRFLNDFKAKAEEVKSGLGDLGDCIGACSIPLPFFLSFFTEFLHFFALRYLTYVSDHLKGDSS
jgi:hypothetical protein